MGSVLDARREFPDAHGLAEFLEEEFNENTSTRGGVLLRDANGRTYGVADGVRGQ